ncbi:MAG: 50S ribosomal protein L9 [Myxococcaceae bacterium]
MRVILREDVPSLGRSGELVNVKDGYGRNYLLPRKLAVIASEQNVKQLEHEKSVITARQAKLKGAAEAQAGKLGNVAVKIGRKVGEAQKEGEVAKLYGSVTALDIAEALASAGHKIDRRTIHLPEPIKTLGKHEVEIRMHRDVTAKVTVEVVGE